MCSVGGREWHLTVWGWTASDQLQYVLAHIESGYSIACLYRELRGGEGKGPQSRGSHFSEPPPCHSQERQTGKSILPLRTVHYKGPPQRRFLSESVPQARWDGSRWQGRCQSTLITPWESDWGLVQHHRQLQTDKDKGLGENVGPRFFPPFPSHLKNMFSLEFWEEQTSSQQVLFHFNTLCVIGMNKSSTNSMSTSLPDHQY